MSALKNTGSYSVNCCFELAGVLLLCFLRGRRFFFLLLLLVVVVVVVVVVVGTLETTSAHDAANFQSGREALSFPALYAVCRFGGSKSDRQRSSCFSEDGRISPVDVAYICKLIFVKTARRVEMMFEWVGGFSDSGTKDNISFTNLTLLLSPSRLSIGICCVLFASLFSSSSSLGVSGRRRTTELALRGGALM